MHPLNSKRMYLGFLGQNLGVNTPTGELKTYKSRTNIMDENVYNIDMMCKNRSKLVLA